MRYRNQYECNIACTMTFMTSINLLPDHQVRFWGQYKRIVGDTARIFYDLNNVTLWAGYVRAFLSVKNLYKIEGIKRC